MTEKTLTENFNDGPLSKEVEDFVYAAEIDDCGALAEFLDKYSSSINKVNRLGQTALMQAARFGKKDAVSLLLEKGADLNATSAHEDAQTPLDLARENDHPAVIAILEGWPEVLRQRWLEATDCSQGLERPIPATSPFKIRPKS